MEKKFKLIVNCETGEQTQEEFTPEEYAQAELFSTFTTLPA